MTTNSTPTINRGGERERTYVNFAINATTTIKYGWLARKGLRAGFGKDLGHTEATANDFAVIYGINSPKPFRARRLEGSYKGLTTFAGSNVIEKLKTDKNWKLYRTSRTRGLSSAKVATVYVKMPESLGGFKYAWNINKDLLTQAQTPLDIKVATGADIAELVWGADTKPPRAILETNERTWQTFAEPTVTTRDKALAAGWSFGSTPYTLQPATP